MNHYIVLRFWPKTLVIDYGKDAKSAYKELCRWEEGDEQCLLAGSDSVETLLTTHASWFSAEYAVVDARYFRWTRNANPLGFHAFA